MRDGVKIAIDICLPPEAQRGEKIPAVIRQTRYLRSVQYHRPYNALLKQWFADVSFPTRIDFLNHGYAWVDVDARGSGASFGVRPCPWYEDEVHDGAEIVDWIIQQPWSNGRVGATGVSYDGTTSEMLMINRHPAVKAVIPQFSLFDAYTDVAFPGGIHNYHFTKCWNHMNQGLDRNDPCALLGMWLGIMTRGRMEKLLDLPALNTFVSGLSEQGGRRLLKNVVKGVNPTDEDPDFAMAGEAIAGHAENLNVHEAALNIDFRDDGVFSPLAPEKGGMGIDYFSPHTYVKEIDASGAAVFSYGGWWDMGYQYAAIKRHLTLSNPDNRLIIGPWDHGGRHYVGPTVGFRKSTYNHEAEFRRFFDFHLKDAKTGMESEAPIRYYTMGEEQWKTSDVWPPRNARTERLYLSSDRGLTSNKPGASQGYDIYQVDYSAGSGDLSRWKSGLGIAIDYSDRKKRDRKLLVYESRPLEQDLEVTGHPLIRLYLSSSVSDGNFFVYLEEVTPSGEVRYVTEGSLRVLHRKLSDAPPPYRMVTPYRTFKKEDGLPLVPGEVAELYFDLLPSSYLFRKGNSIRVAIAGADCDHALTPRGEPPVIHVFRSKQYASYLDLPAIKT